MTERMFHHSWVSFNCPAILFYLCVCLSVSSIFTSGPMGAGWCSPLNCSPHHILGLNAEAKKKRKHEWRVYLSSNSAIVCFILMYAHIHFVLSFNDNFTKTVFILWKDKEYLFTGILCVGPHMEEPAESQTDCICAWRVELSGYSIALLLSGVDQDTSVYNQLKQHHMEGNTEVTVELPWLGSFQG